jgi:hypothetical protein
VIRPAATGTRALGAVLAALTGVCLLSTSAVATSPAGWTELVVELRAGQEAAVTDLALGREGEIWVPATAALDLVEIRSTVDTLGVVRALRLPAGTELVLDPVAQQARRGGERRPLAADRLVRHDDRLFVAGEVLAWLLEVQEYPDLREMTFTLDPVDALPLGRRLRRERMRSIQELATVEPDLRFVAESGPWRGATLDWTLSTPDLGRPEESAYSAAFGGAAFGGGLDLRWRGRADGEGPQELDARWQGVWPDQTWLRQVEAGRARSTGPRPRAITGIALGNSPWLRDSDFGSTVLRGRLEPGWEVEIYRNGRLLAWDRIDERGAWEFTVPLDYGQNPLEIREYGPQGEVRIRQEAVRVDFDRLPGGRFEYGLSAGDCEGPECEQAANADLRYGFNDRWTGRLGWEGFRRPDQGDLHRPYLSLTGSPVLALRLGAERVLDGWWKGLASLEPTPDLRLGLEHQRFDTHVAVPVGAAPDERQRSRVTAFWRPVRDLRSFFLTFDGNRRRREDGTWRRASGGFTAQMGMVRGAAQWNEEEDAGVTGALRRSSLAFQSSMVLRTGRLPLLHGLHLRLDGEIETGRGENDWVSLRVGRRLGRAGRLEVGAAWLRGTDAPLLTITLSSSSSHAYTRAGIRHDPFGNTSSVLDAEGSLLYNPQTNRVETYPYRSLGQGGLSGTVFLDRNGNGVLDAGEHGLPGVRLVAGAQMVETDDYGRWSVWSLAPFEATDLAVDRTSLADPRWLPAFERAVATVSPNGFRRIDLPLLEGVEVEGRVRTRDGGTSHPAGAVPLRLVAEDGGLSYDARTFHDGEFYLMAVAPGRYRVEVEPRWLAARGLALESEVELEIPVGAEQVDCPVSLRASSRPERSDKNPVEPPRAR